jgi:hypothetical protein
MRNQSQQSNRANQAQAARRTLEGAVEAVRQVVAATEPSSLSGDEAQALVQVFCELERAASSGIARYAPVVEAAGTYSRRGHPSAADWLGSLSGCSVATAKGRLRAAERAKECPELAEAVRLGQLSAPQIKLVADTAAHSP